MRGDIDGDGKITENDRNRISEHLGGTITLTGADSWCAKVTGNNEISVSDLVQLMQYLEGKTNNLTGIPTFADYYNNWTYHKVDDLTGYWTTEVVINGLKTTSDAIVNISNDEGIFYKSELSDGAIRFYATRPPIAEVPATITFKSGTGVITTSYESAKFHASTHSKDGADPITPESIGALSLSGGTMTGSLILKDNPVKDLEAATKQYVDNHTSDTVLYTPQTLTDEQKTQVRGNINAAPGGFGLGGGAKPLSAADDLNNIRATGWYDWNWDSHPKNAPDNHWGEYGCTMHVFSTTPGGYAIQTVYDLSDDITHGCAIQRTICPTSSGNIYYPWEWVNPPMKLGVEYRTTERYLGKPVYLKAVDFGTLPNATLKQVAHGVTNAAFAVVDLSRSIAGSGYNNLFPLNTNVSGIDVSDGYINIRTVSDLSGWRATICIKYTKTTD